MEPQRRRPFQISKRDTLLRIGLVSLPFIIVIGALLWGQLPDRAQVWDGITGYLPVRVHTVTSVVTIKRSAKAPVQEATAKRSVQPGAVEAAVLYTPTRPAEVIPTRHGFPDLPDGISAKGPVGVELLLTISKDGAVVDAAIVKSTGSDWLDAQAVDWVKTHWRYHPALLHKKAIAARTTAIVLFSQKRRPRHSERRAI